MDLDKTIGFANKFSLKLDAEFTFLFQLQYDRETELSRNYMHIRVIL